jgi:hypothetical protein
MRAIGAYQIANILRKSGYSVQVVEYYPLLLYQYGIDIIKKIISKYADKDTLWIGFSTTFFYPNFINDKKNIFGKNIFLLKKSDKKELKNYVSQINPKIKWVAGGALSWHFEAGEEFIDCYIEGYADVAVVEYTKFLEKKNLFLPYTKNHDGSISVNYDRKGNLFNFVDHHFEWHESDYINNNEPLPIEISRGCIFRCKFCAYPLNGKKKFDYLKKPENLLNELIENYEKFGTTNYMFADDTYNDSPQKVEILYENVFSKLPFQINWASYIRLDLLHAHPHTVDIIKKSGIKAAFFGIESLNYKSNKLIGKGLTIEKITETLHMIKKSWNDVSLQGGFIIGLPHDSKDSILEWSNKLIDDDYPLDHAVFSVLNIRTFKNNKNKPFWLSEIEKDPYKFGYTFINEDQRLWKNNTGLTKLEAVELRNSIQTKIGQKCKKWGILSIPLLNHGYTTVEDSEISSLDKISRESEDLNEIYKDKIDIYLEKLLRG